MCDFPDRIFLQHKSKVTGDYFIRNFMQCEKQRLDGMLVYAKDYDSSADNRILNSFETHPQIKVLGLTTVNAALKMPE